VPAPAVIPAPGVSMMIAAVKEFVAEALLTALKGISQLSLCAVILQNKECLGARVSYGDW